MFTQEQYETPTFRIDWFEADSELSAFNFSSMKDDFITDNESDDAFD